MIGYSIDFIPLDVVGVEEGVIVGGEVPIVVDGDATEPIKHCW